MPVVLFHDGDRTPRHASLRMALFFKNYFSLSPSASIHASTLLLQSIVQERVLQKTATTHTLTFGDVQGWKRSSAPPHPPPFKKYQTRETLGAATHRSGGGTQRGRREMTSLSLCVCQDRNELLTVDKTSECNNVCCSFFYFPGFSPNMRACCATL